MAQSKKSSVSLFKFNKKILVLFLLVFAGIGGWTIWQTFASSNSTMTVLRIGVSRITPEAGSSGYELTQDTFNFEAVQVAKVSTNGMISFGGKGGGNTPAPVSQQLCYVLRVDSGTSANVQLLGTNGGVVNRTIKAWPYDSAPAPYQYACVNKGTPPHKGPAPNLRVLSGGPVYFYELQAVVTYPY